MRTILFAGLALLFCDTCFAQQAIVMYRCTDAQGAVTLQNDVPCPKGSRQEKRVIEAPPSPAPTPAPVLPTLAPVEPTTSTAAPASAASTTPASPTADAPTTAADTTTAIVERTPPPALHRCSTHDRQRYFSEAGHPEPRCVPLQTIGLDGNPDTGAGQACEMVTDRCEPVADEQLCEAWQQRLRDAETAAGFGKSELAESSKVELERIAAIVRDSTCGETR